ncbi:hypothetical protein A3Q56_06283, partial [Intoshia linei]
PDNISKYENIFISRRCIVNRQTEIVQNLKKKLFDLLSHTTTNFSLAIDESTDATDSAQLLIFARVIDQNFNLFEELLGMQTITGQARGLDVYNQVNELFVQYDLNPLQHFDAFLRQTICHEIKKTFIRYITINKENISHIHFPYLKETSSNTTPLASIFKRFETYLASLYDQYMTRFQDFEKFEPLMQLVFEPHIVKPKNSRTPPILPVPVGKFNEINQCSLPTKSEQGLEEFCYSVNDLKKKTFKITFNRLLDPKIVNLKLLKLLDSKKSEILNAVYSIEVGKVADKRYQILSTKKIPTFLKKYYFTYLNPFMSKYFKQPDVDSILIKYKPTCTHKTKDVYTFMNQCHECIKTPCIEDFAHDIKIQPKIMVNSEDSIMLIFKNSKSSKNQIVECQQIQLTCENQQYVYANNELIENKEFFVTTNGENLCLAFPIQNMNIFKIKDTDYLEKFKLVEIFKDAYESYDNNEEESKYLHSYFSSICDGTQIKNKEYRYISLNIYNKKCFISFFWNTYEKLLIDSEAMARDDFFSLLTLLCPNIDMKVVNYYGIEDQVNYIDSGIRFSYIFQANFYFSDVMDIIKEYLDGKIDLGNEQSFVYVKLLIDELDKKFNALKINKKLIKSIFSIIYNAKMNFLSTCKIIKIVTFSSKMNKFIDIIPDLQKQDLNKNVI